MSLSRKRTRSLSALLLCVLEGCTLPCPKGQVVLVVLPEGPGRASTEERLRRGASRTGMTTVELVSNSFRGTSPEIPLMTS